MDIGDIWHGLGDDHPHVLMRLAPPYRCGTLTHDNHDVALHGAVRGPDYKVVKVTTEGNSATIGDESEGE